MDELTQSRLKSALEYDPETGRFTWRNPASNRVKRGAPAGYRRSSGYWAIRVGGVKYFAHRLAWLYVYGKFPSQFIDHINRDKADNRIANLRDVSQSVNLQNRVLPRSLNPYRGVRVRGKKWEAYHYSNKRYVHLGTFASLSEAVQCRKGVE